jgi:hypothetical protein
MKDLETDRLVAEMEALEPHNGWRFAHEYPGLFCYSHPDRPRLFHAGLGRRRDLPIEVQGDDGGHCEEHSSALPLPREGRTGQQLLDLVRPTLDKLSALPPPTEPTIDFLVKLTAKEIAALKNAHDHVRSHMAHQHPWEAARRAKVVRWSAADQLEGGAKPCISAC